MTPSTSGHLKRVERRLEVIWNCRRWPRHRHNVNGGVCRCRQRTACRLHWRSPLALSQKRIISHVCTQARRCDMTCTARLRSKRHVDLAMTDTRSGVVKDNISVSSARWWWWWRPRSTVHTLRCDLMHRSAHPPNVRWRWGQQSAQHSRQPMV